MTTYLLPSTVRLLQPKTAEKTVNRPVRPF